MISNTQNNNNIKLIKKIGRAKLSVEFTTLKAANDFVDNSTLREKNLSASIPTFRVVRARIIRDDFEADELIASIDAPVKVLSATRLNRKIFREQESQLPSLLLRSPQI